MKKVLVLANHILGIYSFRRELILNMIDEGYEVTIAAPAHEKVSYFTNKGCKFIETPINRRGTNPIVDLKLIAKYFKIVKKNSPDIILTYTIKPNIYGGIISRFMKIPYIANITGLGTVVENKGILQNLTVLLYRISLKNVSCLFFQNEENERFFKNQNIALDRHRLIPGSGVNLNYFGLLDYPDDENVEFLFIARIMQEKGIDQYLEAAEYIKIKYPKTVFHILGNCEEAYVDKLKRMQEKGIIKYHGRQDDVREFHKISHCTIHPTYYPEGMSNVLLESAACGRPVITTNRAGCREIVDDGMNGYIIEPKNTQQLIEKIELFLTLNQDAKSRMGKYSRNKVVREFDRQIVVKAYIEEMNNITNKI
ncbi:glycosyltransferase family 4 protein [uncultured Psychrobacillus sp.]|uniref:glycosyltransferase family 4 protein n=1 Tax=uncultured Psychrobacillus sp. TaxID=1551585 RepID=UPI0026035044|nr:glycosyltransferase family 4 protein [uncultured Psychrobacillus sp.]